MIEIWIGLRYFEQHGGGTFDSRFFSLFLLSTNFCDGRNLPQLHLISSIWEGMGNGDMDIRDKGHGTRTLEQLY